jgi:hypothetical protein
MNYQAMTDDELVHYLSLYSDDPLVKRLIAIIPSIVGELEDEVLDLKGDIEQLKEDKNYWRNIANYHKGLATDLQSKLDMWNILATKNLE